MVSLRKISFHFHCLYPAVTIILLSCSSPGKHPASPEKHNQTINSATSGTCENPLSVTPGRKINASTKKNQNFLQGSCIPGKAPENIYRIAIENPSIFLAEMNADFDGGMYLLKSCNKNSEEIACNDDFEMKSGKSKIKVTLEPGTYYLVIDGFGISSGNYTLETEIMPAPDVSQICSGVVLLKSGSTVRDSTSGGANLFSASCGNGARGSDKLFGINIQQASRIYLFLETPSFDGVLHLYRNCPGESAPLICNDDFEGNTNSMIMTVLTPGAYTVVVDGCEGTDEGEFTLSFDAAPVEGTEIAGDKCKNATPLDFEFKENDNLLTLKETTFPAMDDSLPSCTGSVGGPDIFRKFNLSDSSVITGFIKNSYFSGPILTISEAKTCRELACQMDGLKTILPAGEYVLGIDSTGADQFGKIEIEMRVQKKEALEKICQSAKILQLDKIFDGNTAKHETESLAETIKGNFEGTCGGGSKGYEDVYILKVPQKGNIRIELNPDGFDSVIYLRKSCADWTTEIACNDDAGSKKQSIIEADIDKGTYYIFVDGYGEKDKGSYRIKATFKQQKIM